jgi:hypothetical protein
VGMININSARMKSAMVRMVGRIILMPKDFQ